MLSLEDSHYHRKLVVVYLRWGVLEETFQNTENEAPASASWLEDDNES